MLIGRVIQRCFLFGTCAVVAIVAAGCAGKNTPTGLAGRGNPSLTDPQRPAAWIYIDGKAGHYGESDGKSSLQWIIDEPVSATPSFRVTAFPSLIKGPASFDAVLVRIASEEEKRTDYLLSADSTAFQANVDYPLLAPGDGFVLRSFGLRTVIDKIETLSPGKYMLTGTIRSDASGKQALAVTTFTVAGDATASKIPAATATKSDG